MNIVGQHTQADQRVPKAPILKRLENVHLDQISSESTARGDAAGRMAAVMRQSLRAHETPTTILVQNNRQDG
jgi:hypothetical protein